MNLFDRTNDPCRNRHGGNPESEAAHAAIAPTKATLRDRALDFIRARAGHGATLAEVAEYLGKAVHSVSGRITELKALGKIMPNGERRTTRSGSDAAVYVVVNQ